MSSAPCGSANWTTRLPNSRPRPALPPHPPADGEHVAGTYRQLVTLASDGLGFQLVPWRSALEQKLGQHVSGTMTPGGSGEAEVMSIGLAPFRERPAVRIVGRSVEHARILAIAGDALPLEVGDVPGERRGGEPLPLMADDAGHDDNPPPRRSR